MATITDLCNNVRTLARQTPARVKLLRQPCMAVIGSAGEQWDEEREHHRLPTVTEFWLKIMAGLGRPGTGRRQMTPREIRLLWKSASSAIRYTRRIYPDLCL